MMIEYLDPSDWSLKYHRPTDDAVPADWIKVPKGAVIYQRWPHKGNEFHDKDGNIITGSGIRKIPWTLEGLRTWRTDTIWDRDKPVHPEELPFIDDEPPAYYGNAIRPKPRQRVYAVMGDKVPECNCVWCVGV